jgi:hypothetical protein
LEYFTVIIKNVARCIPIARGSSLVIAPAHPGVIGPTPDPARPLLLTTSMLGLGIQIG